MDRGTIRTDWITVNGVPTRVKTWGGWIEDDLEVDSLILFIPATPGVTDFYDKFLETLYLNLRIPVWVIGHAGLQLPSPYRHLDLPSIKHNPHLYDLNGQIEHKKQFINRYIKKMKCLNLIGHSIGAKICIELMKNDDIANKTKQIHLLFPAIHQLANTPKGWMFTRIWSKLAPLVIFMTHLFICLPYYIRYTIIRIIIILRTYILSIEPCYIHAILELTKPQCTRCAFFLGQSSMMSVRDLDDDVMTRHHAMIRAYFSPSDKWVPKSHYEYLRKQYPYVKTQLLEPNYKHDFLLNTSVPIANKISNEIKSFT
ncbi:hypothetical protein O3M35_006792 [Rhynocoris fuscipes]|uniref:Lipid droplet-associated hydrolase n=1 Tax=Rhynocoris fuscipes TaxID=488301 RepID=A0AAW1DG38_9HEMI